MRSKRVKSQPLNIVGEYVLLRDNKTSCHQVVRRDQLSYAKIDNLDIGTLATFHGGDNSSDRFRGIVITSGKFRMKRLEKSALFIFTGTKEECNKNISSIEKDTNNKKSAESNSDSDASNHSETNGNNNNNNEQSNVEREISTSAPMCSDLADVIRTYSNSKTSSNTNSTNCSSLLLSPTTAASSPPATPSSAAPASSPLTDALSSTSAILSQTPAAFFPSVTGE
jgi:hypothetical protein